MHMARVREASEMAQDGARGFKHRPSRLLPAQLVTPHYASFRLRRSMRARTTSLIVSACRRGFAAVVCALMLMMAVVPTDLAPDAGSAQAGQVELLAASGGSGDAPVHPDGLPCHCAHHVCSKVTPTPPTIVGSPAVCLPQFEPVPAPSRVLLSDLSELPTKPPRA